MGKLAMRDAFAAKRTPSGSKFSSEIALNR